MSNDFNRFAYNPVDIDIGRSMFDMDHNVKFSFNCGDVVPFTYIPVVPGDTFEIDTTKVIRLQPLITPIMDEVICDIYYFFIPHRLVWNHFVEMMGENNESAWAPQVEYNVPQIQVPVGGFDVGTIADYLGIPPLRGGGAHISALPFRGYALVCDQWFRSEALMNPVHVHVDDSTRVGVNTGDQVTDIELGGKPFVACKFFDYFTSALPAPQRGEPVSIPVIDAYDELNLPVRQAQIDSNLHKGLPYYKGKNASIDNSLHVTYVNAPTGERSGTTTELNTSQTKLWSLNVVPPTNTDPTSIGKYSHVTMDNTNGITASDTYMRRGVYLDNLYVNLPGSSIDSITRAVTINDLRTAFAVQRYLEKSARFGGRYISFIKGFFGVDSPDARLQRTEFLGGSRISLNINQVEQTSATTQDGTPQGNVAGMSVTAERTSDFTKSFTEFGAILGVCVLRYHHTYSDGVEKFWFRKDKYDFYNPVFANLGEVPIYDGEIYFEGSDDSNRFTFGYQECWADYRFKPNSVRGELRPGVPNSLDMWHLADHYPIVGDSPTLSSTWIREDKTNLDRVLAVNSSTANQAIADFYLNVKAVRPLPMYSIPGLIDHH